MADFDGLRVDVGDKKTLEVVSTDSSGSKLNVDAEVAVAAPSGASTTYTNADMTESDSTLYLELLFDEAGYWHVHVKVEEAGGQETDSGYIRAVTKAPVELQLLTRDVWHEHLSEDAMAEGPETLHPLIQAAEKRVIDRYREKSPRTDNLIVESHYDNQVRLDGWVETNDDPDLQQIDSGLLDALRRVVASLVDHDVTSPDQHVLSMSQGDRSVDYTEDAGELPSGMYAPLRPYDDRRRFHF